MRSQAFLVPAPGPGAEPAAPMVLPDLPFLIPFNKPSSTFACESPQVLLGFPPDHFTGRTLKDLGSGQTTAKFDPQFAFSCFSFLQGKMFWELWP